MATISTIRPAIPDDISRLSEYWYDSMTLLQQTHRHIRLLPDARQQWAEQAHAWCEDEAIIFLCGLADDEIVGCIMGEVRENAPGLAPARYGMVRYLVIDLHTRHVQRGAGRLLLSAFIERLSGQAVTQLRVAVPAQAVVEQAFWHGMGARHGEDIFWMGIE